MLQIVIAIALWLYMPLEFRREMMNRMNLPPSSLGQSLNLPPEILSRYYPPVAGRTLYVINLPATVLSNAVGSHIYGPTPAWEFKWPRNSAHGIVYVFGVREVLFLIGIVLLWLWSGHAIDNLIRKRKTAVYYHSAISRIVERVVVFGTAAFLLVASVVCILDNKCPEPEQQIAAFGLIWPILLFIFLIASWQKANKAVPNQ